MNIPKSVNVLGRIYKVIIHNEVKTGNDHLGTHWGNKTAIYLNKNQSSQSMDSCFIHEILEAINYLQQLRLKHDQISRIETALYQVLKENKLRL